MFKISANKLVKRYTVKIRKQNAICCFRGFSGVKYSYWVQFGIAAALQAANRRNADNRHGQGDTDIVNIYVRHFVDSILQYRAGNIDSHGNNIHAGGADDSQFTEEETYRKSKQIEI